MIVNFIPVSCNFSMVLLIGDTNILNNKYIYIYSIYEVYGLIDLIKSAQYMSRAVYIHILYINSFFE